jgi:hypothetical protein
MRCEAPPHRHRLRAPPDPRLDAHPRLARPHHQRRTGELIRELDTDPARDYQPDGQTKKTPNPLGVQGHSDVLRPSHWCAARDLNPEPAD